MSSAENVSVRYIVDDVAGAVDFYTRHLGFVAGATAGAAFAEVRRGALRLLLSGPASSGYRATPTGSTEPGRNRIHLIVEDVAGHAERLAQAGVPLRSEVVSGPGGQQVLIADPAGNLVELFEPAPRGR